MFEDINSYFLAFFKFLKMKFTSYLFIFVLFIFFSSPANAQMEDFNWFASKTDLHINDITGLTFFQFSKTDSFTKYNPEIKADRIRDGGSIASISDPEGNLLFFTDGFDIFNKNFEIMENGEKIAYSGIVQEFYYRPTGAILPNRIIILPHPSKELIYYVVYGDLRRDSDNPNIGRCRTLYYSMVDLSKNDGLGEVTTKNKQLLREDFAHSCILPVRHANGRDWWILQKHWDEARWFVFLLDPSGIRLSHETQLEGFPGFYERYAEISWEGDQIVYLTGDHFYPWIPPDNVNPANYEFHLFNFDRCSGQIGFEWSIAKELISAGGNKFVRFCIEWKSQNLYFSNGQYYMKMNIGSSDMEISHDTILIREELGYSSSGMYFPKITPLGELWVNHWNSDKVTVFRNPELGPGEENLVPEPIELYGSSSGSFPYFPNFRLGPIDGSACDTLGINNKPKAWFRYNDMNLEPYERRFTDISYFRPEQWHWDFDDGSTFDGQEPGVHEFPGPGEYYVCLTVSNEFAEDTYCQWVIIEQPSNVREEVQESRYSIFPNPATDEIFIVIDQPISHDGEVRIYNLEGKLMLHLKMNKGEESLSISTAGLSRGYYFVQFNDGKSVEVQPLIIK